MRLIKDIAVSGKTVLVRCDFNVPMAAGSITDDTRIRKALPTIQYLLAQGAVRVVLMSHLGRPKEGVYDVPFSLQTVADRLAELLKQPVELLKHFTDLEDASSQVCLLENVRFNVGEKGNHAELAKQYAQLADVFVMDAFGTAHRAQASTTGVAEYSVEKALGLLMAEELEHLEPLIHQPKKPVLAIIGGSKISTKLDLLKALLDKVDRLIIGGGMANTFLQAQGYAIGASLTEEDLVDTAKQLLIEAEKKGVAVGLPKDVVVVQTFDPQAPAQTKLIQDVQAADMIIDAGPETSAIYQQLVDGAQTIIWNGPVGIVEWSTGERGTIDLGKAIANSNAFSVAGGGDTVAFINKHHLDDQVNYLSTGGGAFLAYLEGKTLPAVTALAS